MAKTTDSLLAQIRREMATMSKAQRAIAGYLLAHYEEAAYLTAAKIGLEAKVSEATVVRFAKALGFDGFPQFQKNLQDELKGSLTSVQRLRAADRLLREKDVLNAVFMSDLAKIRQTYKNLDRDAFEQAVNAILEARTIYVLGFRSAAALSSFLGYYLSLLFDNVRLVYSTSVCDCFEQMVSVTAGDLVIGISFPRYSQRTIKAMAFARSRQATVLVLTDKPDSRIAGFSDLALLAPSDMASFADSLVAPLSLINALIAAVVNQRREYFTERLERYEQFWLEQQTYGMKGEDVL